MSEMAYVKRVHHYERKRTREYRAGLHYSTCNFTTKLPTKAKQWVTY
jgi:hypothetical protein